MTENSFKNILAFAKKSGAREKFIIAVSKIVPWVIVAVFAAAAVFLVISGDKKALRFILVPAAVFVFVTVLRKVINAERPYEVFDIKSLTGKIKSGESFPSRHTASAAIIAFACFYLNPVFGAVMLIFSGIVAVTRVLCAVHFPRDVIAALIISAAGAVIGFYLI